MTGQVTTSSHGADFGCDGVAAPFSCRERHDSMSLRTVAAVSSMERRVTSIVGQPWEAQRRLAQSNSFSTAS